MAEWVNYCSCCCCCCCCCFCCVVVVVVEERIPLYILLLVTLRCANPPRTTKTNVLASKSWKSSFYLRKTTRSQIGHGLFGAPFCTKNLIVASARAIFLKNLLPTAVALTFFKNASLARLCPFQNSVLVAVRPTFLLLWKLPPSKCSWRAFKAHFSSWRHLVYF